MAGEQNGSEQGPSPAARAWPRLWVIAAGAVLLAAAGFFVVTREDSPGPVPRVRPGTVVAEFDGRGNETTPLFTVEEGWQIHWETRGTQFRMRVSGDRDLGVVVDLGRKQIRESGSGITSPVGAGRFRLNVVARGPWTIRVIQGDPAPTTSATP